MFESFWKDAGIISVYTDGDARDDGFLTDVSALFVGFNGKLVNRLTSEASAALNFERFSEDEQRETLEQIVSFSRFDGEGADAWGICNSALIAGGEKLWLIPNEVNGYTLMLPDEY